MTSFKNASLSLSLAAVVFGLQTGFALAQTFDVKQLEIKKGEVELGLDNTFHSHVPHARGSDINRTINEVGLDYGALSWWKISGVFKFEKPEQDEYRFSKVALESLFIIKDIDDKAQRDFGLGWFASIEGSVHSDTTNAVQAGPIVTFKADKLSFTANPFFERTFGRNHIEGTALVYGWQAKYDLREGFAVGIEGFGVVERLGNSPAWEDQEHRLGPVIYKEVELAKGITIAPDVGVLFGLTRATPDVAVKFNVGIPLYQQATGRKGD